uniref:Uncharacterized protein n=1 Tax=Timema cristinae TaxID=61476 RepID=A0A7R9CTI3_TIMCR|nr:unnamed protein product [Timema cristinae]
MQISQTLGVFTVTLLCMAQAQYNNNNQYTTPVPILKQINKHNEDGSYSYGYEAADGSYKIESKHPTGEVYGKYGYVDDSGSVREVEYGASRRGFEPSGSDINVPPPTLQNSYTGSNSVSGNDYDDGQYHEDPSVYYKNTNYNSAPRQSLFNNPAPAPQQNYNYNPPARQQQYYDPPAPQRSYYNPPAQQYNPPQRYNPTQQYNAPRPAPARVDPNQFAGHPATSFDVNTGSYSLSYSG